MIDQFWMKEEIVNTNVISANAQVISPLIFGLSLDTLSPYSQGAPSAYCTASIWESAMPHTTAIIARIARFAKLEAEHESGTEETQDGKDLHLGIDLLLDSTPLTGRASRIQDDLSLGASEKNDTNDPVRVPEYRTAKKNRLHIH